MEKIDPLFTHFELLYDVTHIKGGKINTDYYILLLSQS